MKIYAPHQRRQPRHIRVPAFLPVPLRPRADGWTPQRQAAFLVALAASGSVSDAARKVGMARESAYQLRKRAGAESFAAVWDFALHGGRPERKLTSEARLQAALSGRIKPVVFRGECVAVAQKADNSAFLALFNRMMREQGTEPV